MVSQAAHVYGNKFFTYKFQVAHKKNVEVARSRDYGISLARNYERNFCSHTINGSAQHEPVSAAAAEPYKIKWADMPKSVPSPIFQRQSQ
jgi:hypothetical protein